MRVGEQHNQQHGQQDGQQHGSSMGSRACVQALFCLASM